MLRRMKKVLMLWMVLLLLTSSIILFAEDSDAIPIEGQQEMNMFIFAPDDVEMETSFIIAAHSATSGQGQPTLPLPDVKIILEWEPGEEYFTDNEGNVTVMAPTVSENKSYMIYGNRGGFANTSRSILIIHTPQLEIFCTDEVEEGTDFLVAVGVGPDRIEGVSVKFIDEVLETNETGRVEFTAPYVDKDTSFPIEASKDGYKGAVKYIEVTDYQDSTIPELEIYVAEEVLEEESFPVSISADGIPVQGVEVTFNGVTEITPENGRVQLTAPEVEEDSLYIITAYYEGGGYEPDTELITILNDPSKDVGDGDGDEDDSSTDGEDDSDAFSGVPVGAEIYISLAGDTATSYYLNELTIDVTTVDGEIYVDISNSADEETVIRIDCEGSDAKQLIGRDEDQILKSDTDDGTTYYITMGENEHAEIQITEIAAALSSTAAMMTYSIISIVSFLVFLTPMMIRLTRRMRSQKKNN